MFLRCYSIRMSTNVFTPRPEIASAINYVANTDPKALGYSALVSEGENTASSLASVVADHTGVYASKSLVSGYPITFRTGGFARSRLGLGANGRDATFYRATRETVALPVVGTLLEWADLHKQSLISVLSSTPSKGQSRGPLNTVQILDGLLQGLNIGEMELPGYKRSSKGHDTSHNSRLISLVEAGLVEGYEDPNEFRILDPIYGGRVPFSRLKAQTQVTYQLLALAKEANPLQQWNAARLIDFAENLNIVNQVGKLALSESLVTAASIAQPRDFPGAIEKIHIKPRQYKIAPGFEEAADDLVERLYKINEGKRTVTKQATDLALDAYLDPIIAAKILERGIAHSPYVKTRLI